MGKTDQLWIIVRVLRASLPSPSKLPSFLQLIKPCSFALLAASHPQCDMAISHL